MKAKLAVAAALLLSWCGTAAAAEITGRVLNATTGQPVPGQSVNLLALRGQMVPLREAETDSQGRFTFVVAANLNERFLIQVPFRGVNYTQPAFFSSGERITADIQVYDTGARPEDVRIAAHTIFVEPHSGHVRISEFYALANRSAPPRTFAPDEGSFRFTLPAGAGDLQVAATRGSSGMPLRQQPQPTDRENTFAVSFPIYPGDSEIQLSYAVPATGAAVELNLPIVQSSERRHIAIPRAGVEVESKQLKEIQQEQVPQARVFEANVPAPGTSSLKLKIDPAALEAAEAAAPAAAPATTSESAVTIVPAPINRAQWYIVGLTLAVLFLGLFYLYSLQPSERTTDAGRRQPQRRPNH